MPERLTGFSLLAVLKSFSAASLAAGCKSNSYFSFHKIYFKILLNFFFASLFVPKSPLVAFIAMLV